MYGDLMKHGKAAAAQSRNVTELRTQIGTPSRGQVCGPVAGRQSRPGGGDLGGQRTRLETPSAQLLKRQSCTIREGACTSTYVPERQDHPGHFSVAGSGRRRKSSL